MYSEGDWVVEKNTGRVGILRRKHWCEVTVRFGDATAIRHPEEVELAPLDIRKEDILDLQCLTVTLDQREWFEELSERLKAIVDS
jgi:hypothetical protein